MKTEWRYYATLERWYLETECQTIASIWRHGKEFVVGPDTIIPEELLPRRAFARDHECKAHIDAILLQLAESVRDATLRGVEENDRYRREAVERKTIGSVL